MHQQPRLDLIHPESLMYFCVKRQIYTDCIMALVLNELLHNWHFDNKHFKRSGQSDLA